MKEKLLITGGSGFVAYHIIGEALKQHYDVYVSIRPSSSTAHLKDFDIKFTTVNFADVAAIRSELEEKQYDYIIHTAGTTKAGNQQEYDRINALFTANLATAASTARIALKKFVFVSSLAAVGPSGTSGIINENKVMNPVTGYGKSKMLAEQMLKKIDNLPLITFRPTAVYGPREKDILIVLKTIIKGIEPYIGNKPQQLSFVYVKDLAKLMIDALHTPVTGMAYNISDGRVYDKFALATITKKIMGNKTVRFHLPAPVVSMLAGLLEAASIISKKTPALNREKINELTASWACSIDAAKHDLNFLPQYDLQSGLQETLQWYKTNKWI